MSVLNLDAPEEVETPCYLCLHTNYDYLLQMQDQLGDLSGDENMYRMMYEAFKRRTNQPLDREHKDIGFAQFENHFNKVSPDNTSNLNEEYSNNTKSFPEETKESIKKSADTFFQQMN